MSKLHHPLQLRVDSYPHSPDDQIDRPVDDPQEHREEDGRQEALDPKARDDLGAKEDDEAIDDKSEEPEREDIDGQSED